MDLGSAATAFPLAPGQTLLDGRLVIERLIGSGSMGFVYRAEDRAFGRRVALKTLTNFDADRLYQLKREFRTLEGLSHPNLVHFYWLGNEADIWFLTMELVVGQELSAWLRTHPTRERLLRVFGDVAEALRALHEAGLMHRDVKPANVMVTGDDHAVLLDFGLAAPIRNTAATLTAGTLDYIAPEQLWNEAPGPPADWYSFGAMLYEGLTGVLPFSGPARLKAMRGGLREGPAALVPDLPPSIDSLVVRLLDPKPSRRPDARELSATFELRHAHATPVVSRPQEHFVGRAAALTQLRNALDQLPAAGATVVVVRGPSGIGKSTLVRHFLTEVRRTTPNALVCEGGCHPQESVPFNALDALVDNLARHLLGLDQRVTLALAPRHAGPLLHLFPVLGRVAAVRDWPSPPVDVTPEELRRHAFDALRELLAKIADRQPFVLWIDDAQWSDTDSGEMLRSVLVPPDAPRLLLILTSRQDSERLPLTATLAQVITPAEVTLDPLSTHESQDLLHALGPAITGRTDFDTMVSEAGGSPFLLNEMVRYLREMPHEERDAVSLTHIVRRRLQDVDADAKRLLEVVAIAGRPLRSDFALDAAGLGTAGRSLLYDLCTACMLRIRLQDGQELVETYHDQLREATLAGMTPDAAIASHRALASSLRASRTPDVRALVHHYLAAGDVRDAVHFAMLAAEQAERDLAFDQAVAMYDIVLQHGPPAGRDLLERRAIVLAHAGRRTEAALAYEAAASLCDDVISRTPIRVQAAEQYFYGGELQKGLSLLHAVLDDVGVRVPSHPLLRTLEGQWRRIRFLLRGHEIPNASLAAIDPATRLRLDALWRTTRGIVMLDPALADVLAGAHLLESLRSGDAARAVCAIGLEAAFEANIGGRWFGGRSRRLLAAADAAARKDGDAYQLAWLAHCRAACAWFEGRWAECLELGVRAESQLRAVGIGVTWDLTVLRGFMLSALGQLGRLRELRREIDVAVTDAERRGDQYSLRVFRTGDAVLAWLADDRPQDALRVADDTLRDYPPRRFTSQHRHHLVATTQTHLYLGAGPTAWNAVDASWPLLRSAGFLLLDCLGTQLRYLRGCAALAAARTSHDTRDALLLVSSRQARWIRRSSLPMAVPMALALEAGVAGARGHHDAQRRTLEQASRAFAAAGMLLHAHAATWHLAAHTTPRSDAAEAALEWMQQEQIAAPDRLARAVVPEM